MDQPERNTKDIMQAHLSISHGEDYFRYGNVLRHITLKAKHHHDSRSPTLYRLKMRGLITEVTGSVKS